MHPNPAFRGVDPARSLAAARERGFGTLIVPGDPLPETAHLPFLLDVETRRATMHLRHDNPALPGAGAPRPAVLSVLVLDSYISPDWYGAADQVPTWNYVAVRLEGQLHRLDGAALRGHLDALTARFEAALRPKAPWTADKMDPARLQAMMRAIVPVEMRIVRVDATWKLAQNKPEAQRLAAADALADHDDGLEAALLADLMRNPPG